MNQPQITEQTNYLSHLDSKALFKMPQRHKLQYKAPDLFPELSFCLKNKNYYQNEILME